jgi:hypothetical protein
VISVIVVYVNMFVGNKLQGIVKSYCHPDYLFKLYTTRKTTKRQRRYMQATIPHSPIV